MTAPLPQLLERIAKVSPFHLRDAPLPCPEDALIASALGQLAALPEAERVAQAAVLRRYPYDQLLQVYAVRCCTRAIRAGDRAPVREAALALALQGVQDRASFLGVSAVWDAETRLGGDGDALLREFAALAAPDARKSLLAYADTGGKHVDKTGWRVVQTRTGPAYRHAIAPKRGDEL